MSRSLISAGFAASEFSEQASGLQLEEPKKYKVYLLNDDYTPMEFVVDVLKRFFHASEEVAVQLMLEVHTQGRAVCGIYTCDVAETKVVSVNNYAQLNEYPLLCGLEQA